MAAHDGHAHTPQTFGRAFSIGIALNSGYVVVEAVIGVSIGSLGLVVDAGHNASDVLALILAWLGTRMARRPPSERFTYGLRRSPILSLLFNALLLFGAWGSSPGRRSAGCRTPPRYPAQPSSG